jgi:hypothetical protein
VIQSIRGCALALVLGTGGCRDRHQCEDFTTAVVETSSTIMHHPLAQPRFEAVLTHAQGDIEKLQSVPQLNDAKLEYRTKMAEAIALASKASASPPGPAVINANASARAEAAKATYHLMERTNLHCAGER